MILKTFYVKIKKCNLVGCTFLFELCFMFLYRLINQQFTNPLFFMAGKNYRINS
jgi:hypothetical protein